MATGAQFPALPDGWQYKLMSTGKYLYWEEESSTGTYQHPVTGMQYSEVGMLSVDGSQLQPKHDVPFPPLPEGWSYATRDTTYFFFNTVTGAGHTRHPVTGCEYHTARPKPKPKPKGKVSRSPPPSNRTTAQTSGLREAASQRPSSKPVATAVARPSSKPVPKAVNSPSKPKPRPRVQTVGAHPPKPQVPASQQRANAGDYMQPRYKPAAKPAVPYAGAGRASPNVRRKLQVADGAEVAPPVTNQPPMAVPGAGPGALAGSWSSSFHEMQSPAGGGMQGYAPLRGRDDLRTASFHEDQISAEFRDAIPQGVSRPPLMREVPRAGSFHEDRPSSARLGMCSCCGTTQLLCAAVARLPQKQCFLSYGVSFAPFC